MSSTLTELEYRYIYVVQAGFDFSPLRGKCKEIRFITSGLENYDDLLETVERNLSDFDPKQDAVIPVGRSIASSIVGIVIGKKFPNTRVSLGVYQNDDKGKFYRWIDQ
jgi:hypothetical protein